MADVELVIKIPDDIYEQAINGTEYDTLSLGIKLRQSVQEGVVIPKGHGRLIDADYLRCKIAFVERSNISMIVDNAPTIIEADKEEQG